MNDGRDKGISWNVRLSMMTMACLVASGKVGASGSKSPYMHQGKKHTITVNANVPRAAVMEEGLFVGHAGAAFDSAVGVHELIVSAPGHVPRLVRVNVTSAAEVVQVNLAPTGGKNTEVEIDYAQAKKFVTKVAPTELSSLCAAYHRAKTGPLARELLLPCARETVVDDFAFLGPSWAASGLKDALEDASYWQAETAYAAAPGDSDAAVALGFRAALRSDCGRVLEVAMENASYKSSAGGAPGLVFLRGLCFEMAGQPDKAARLYLHLGSQKPPPPDILYHLARVQAPVAPDSAVKTLRVCTKAHPAYYPCYEAAAHVQAFSNQRERAEATMRVYHKRTRDVLAQVLRDDSIDGNLLSAALVERPFSFELHAARILLARQAGATLPTLPVDTTLVSDPGVVKRLLPRLEEVVTADKLTPVYLLQTRQFPDDPSGWIRLATAYRASDRCSESLKASDQAMTLIQNDRRRVALLISSTECLVRLDRLTDAEDVLTKVIETGAASWKAYYNLGVVQERLGKTDAALRSFELALADELPEAIRGRIEAKLTHYRAAAEEAARKAKRRKGQAPAQGGAPYVH